MGPAEAAAGQPQEMALPIMEVALEEVQAQIQVQVEGVQVQSKMSLHLVTVVLEEVGG